MHFRLFSVLVLSACSSVATVEVCAQSEDWRAFRGTNYTASSETPVPQTWDEESNIIWQAELPGPGSSSPILVGDSIYLTCWTGPDAEQQDPADLKRHLLCIDRASGETNWTVSIDRAEKEDPYEGRLANHGYASSTVVADGERLYVFFGKAGVFAFDMDGRPALAGRSWR